MAKIPQLSFTAGELSPSLHARADLARYATGLKQCKNFRVLHTGGVSNREGTEYVSAVGGNGETRLIPFNYNSEQAYMLEFGEEYIHIYVDGAPLPGPPTNITLLAWQIGGFPPATVLPPRLIITLAAPMSLTVGMQVSIAGTTVAGNDWINGVHEVLEVISSTSFIIAAQTADGLIISSPTGTVSVLLEVATPYQVDDLDELRWTQSADILTVVHPDYPPYQLSRLSANSFTFTEAVFDEGPFEDINDDEVLFVHASSEFGVVTLTATQAIFTAEHVGALFYLEQRDGSTIPPWEANRRLAASGGGNCLGEKRISDQKTYLCVTNYAPATNEVITGTIKPTHEHGVAADGHGDAITDGAERAGVDWLYLHSGFGILRITAFISSTQVTALVLSRLPDTVVGGATTTGALYTMTGDGSDSTLAIAAATEGDPTQWVVTFDGVIQPLDSYSVDIAGAVMTFATPPALGVDVEAQQLSSNNRSDVWAFGAWSDVNGYPSVVEYYDNRIIYAATRAQPATLWMSVVDDYARFIQSRPIVDDDSITATINAKQVNKVTNLVPLDSLMVLTKGIEWLTQGGADNVITPSSISFRPQSSNGTKGLPVHLINKSALYIQDRGNRIRDLLSSVDEEGNAVTVGDDLTVTAEHLFKNRTIVDWTLQVLPSKTVWIALDNGDLLSLTYLKEHQVIGWASHGLGGNGLVRRVCCIPEGDEDRLYLIVERDLGGVATRSLERMASRAYEHVRDSIFLDACISYDGRNTDETTVVTLIGSAWSVNDIIDLNANVDLFSADDIGDEVVLAYGETNELRLTITEFVDEQNVKVSPNKDVAAGFRFTPTSAWAMAHDTFSGLAHAEGQEVMVLADANVEGPFTVEDEAITIEHHSVVVHVGFGYNSDLETLDLQVSNGHIRGNAKNIPNIEILVDESRGIFAGKDANNLTEYKQRDESDNYSTMALKTGLAPIDVECDWDKSARVFIRQSYPLPLTILSITPDVKFGGSG